MNYTKGPWLYLEMDDTIIGGQNRTARIIAKVGDLPRHDDYIMQEREAALAQAIGDARLIAAAPDMYEACQSVIALWEEWAHRSDCLQEPLRRSIEMRVEECKAAIAKAEGR